MNILRVFLTCTLIFEQVLFPVCGAFAQESDKPFMQDMQGPGGDEGGPMLEEQGDAPSGEDTALQSTIAQGQTPGSPMDAVKIGGGAPREVPMYEEAESVSPLDRKIGPIRLKNAPLSTFLDVVSAQSKVNFIISEGLEAKTVTVFLRKTTVREALELLLRVKGLTYQRIGKSNTYVVQKRSAGTPNLITKIYTLNYIPLIPITSASDDASAISSQDVSSSLSGGGEATPASGGKVGGGGEAESAIAILNIVRSVLSRQNGKIATDPRTNTLIITDVPEVFPQVEQIIAELDKKAPQILIEAQIVEINTDRMNELGIEWGGSRGEMASFTGPSRLTDYGVRPGFFSGDQWKSFFPKVSNSSDGKGDITPGVFSLAQLQAIFRALISKGEARYLGKPKIVAMNNKTALIQIARDAAMGAQSTTDGGGGKTSTALERRRVGLTFRVTPQVNKEGYVTLIVQPSYTDSVASAVTLQGATVYDPISRGASTMVRVKNGQTVVIGGMLSSTEAKSVKKVPLLGYIPIIGWLFTSVSSRRSNTDLVIFVTPTILVD
ncbi:MAG: hypothetical protein A2234_00045 [Elusimicrobia bacterium RIFOXYA2_FULL_58_8]|nr:MAG: hypothetical protein A2285_05970 [Elusimicrobia bacterium RIFOXYA12_FULL_57_11]OGS15243.1 MAG: hypothetical protein A2234_00045 [Elusimicrobia bacterium RIFOXYA2_FULL_58_8]